MESRPLHELIAELEQDTIDGSHIHVMHELHGVLSLTSMQGS